MTISLRLWLTFCGLFAAACAPHQARYASADDGAVRNVILMIADGAGATTWTAAKYANDDLAVARMPVVGLVDTRSATHKVSDSAAGASVFATGERTRNRTISVGPASACPPQQSGDTQAKPWPVGCEPLETWFGIARDKGKATGVVTTTLVIDATPAAFVVHSPSRYWFGPLAADFADAGLDVLMGGGAGFFRAENRADGRDLIGEMCARSTCLATAAELLRYRAGQRPLVGLFAETDMDDEDERAVALPDMVQAALDKLARDPEGFVAMFETEATDNATHANLPLERITADMLEFDRAVEVALDFARRTPGTLLVVTSDHETGGFSLVEAGEDFEVRYTTHGHTAAMVPLFAFGPQSERFGGLRDNAEIGRLFMEIASGW